MAEIDTSDDQLKSQQENTSSQKKWGKGTVRGRIRSVDKVEITASDEPQSKEPTGRPFDR